MGGLSVETRNSYVCYLDEQHTNHVFSVFGGMDAFGNGRRPREQSTRGEAQKHLEGTHSTHVLTRALGERSFFCSNISNFFHEAQCRERLLKKISPF